MGIYGTFTNIEEFNMELIPFDYDLLSMEMESSFRVSELKKKQPLYFTYFFRFDWWLT